MSLIQQRDLCMFDLESTGLDTENDRIIEIAIVKRKVDKSIEKLHTYIHPYIEISKGATEIHGINNDDPNILNAPTFPEIAGKIYEFFRGCDIGGFNIFKFDLLLLSNEMERYNREFPDWDCNYIDVGNIYKRKEERTLVAAVKFYLDQVHEGAHGALSDTEKTLEVLLEQLERYDDLPRNIKDLAFYSNYDKPVLDFAGKFTVINGKICYNFGNKRGTPVEEDTGLAEWMLTKDFPSNSKKVCEQILRDIR